MDKLKTHSLTIFDIVSKDLYLMILLIVATDVYALFDMFVKRIAT